MGSWDWDLEAGTVTGSPQMEQLIGLPRGRFDGDPASFWRVVFPDDAGALLTTLDDARRTRQRFRAEFRVVHPDGRVAWLMAHGDFLRDEAGRPFRMLGVAKDITERKLREQQLVHMQQLETVRLLAGGVAHDFNNMLASIMGYAGHARADVAESSEAAHCLGEIEHAATRAGELCRQLLTFAGRAPVTTAPIEAEGLVRDIARLLAVVVPPTTRLAIEVDAPVPAVEGDAVQLRQVVMNLVVNATEALDGEPGEVTVRLTTADVASPAALSAWASPECVAGRYVVLEVRDTGSGIDAGVLARIFDPFFSTKPTGRGLGLATVLGIVDRHGGFVAVDSVPGRGTTFRIHLPATVG
ncbi:MAG: ATP-binding protein [Gemmatimonadaceae bacterium]|nr:ATP-binding protein [Gemmatimonadaceae bacterium]